MHKEQTLQQMQARRFELWDMERAGGLSDREKEELDQLNRHIKIFARQEANAFHAWRGTADTEEQMEAIRCRGET